MQCDRPVHPPVSLHGWGRGKTLRGSFPLESIEWHVPAPAGKEGWARLRALSIEDGWETGPVEAVYGPRRWRCFEEHELWSPFAPDCWEKCKPRSKTHWSDWTEETSAGCPAAEAASVPPRPRWRREFAPLPRLESLPLIYAELVWRRSAVPHPVGGSGVWINNAPLACRRPWSGSGVPAGDPGGSSRRRMPRAKTGRGVAGGRKWTGNRSDAPSALLAPPAGQTPPCAATSPNPRDRTSTHGRPDSQ